MNPSSILSRGACLLALALGGAAQASTVTYNDYMAFQAITVGGTTYGCTSAADPDCAFISIVGVGSSHTVSAFNVVGASGFTNVLSFAHITASTNSGVTVLDADIDLSQGGLYVSVDQTNRGAGFGSSYGPTYPLATYGPAGLGTYDLVSDFFGAGFGPFCTDITLCDQGQPLWTTAGQSFTVLRGLGPAYSSFSASVSPDPVPEPGSAPLVALSLAALLASRRAGPRR